MFTVYTINQMATNGSRISLGSMLLSLYMVDGGLAPLIDLEKCITCDECVIMWIS